MATESKPAAAPVAASAPIPTKGIIADRDMYLAEDERTVVEKGDAKARFLLAARGSMIEPAVVQRYALSAKGGKVQAASPKEAAAKAKEAGLPVDLGRVNEGQIRDPGEPLVLAPRAGVMRPQMAERVIDEPGTEVDLAARRVVAVSNVPPEDDELRAKVAEETRDQGAQEQAAQERGAAAKTAAAKKTRARKAGR
jgi:hypothetical protein